MSDEEEEAEEEGEKSPPGDWSDGDKKKKRRRKRRRRRDNDGGGGGGGSDDDYEDTHVRGYIPREILKLTSAVAVRLGLSAGQHTTMTAAFLKACDLDLGEFPLSVSTAARRRKEVLEERYGEDRARFKQQVEENNSPLILHVDTKLLADTIGPEGSRVTNKSDRLAVVVSSPSFNGEQFVCAPGLDNGTGRAQAQGAIEGLDELGVTDYLVGVVYDTTASNSWVLGRKLSSLQISIPPASLFCHQLTVYK